MPNARNAKKKSTIKNTRQPKTSKENTNNENNIKVTELIPGWQV